MPTRKRTSRKRTSRKRRSARKGQRRSNRTMLSTRGKSTIPDKLFTTMQYSDNVTLTSTGGVVAAYQFQSSCFDPNLTGVGHQPLGFDQWASFYTKYRVHGIGYKITFINTNTSVQVDVSVMPKNVSTTTIPHNTIWERPYTKHKILGIEGSGQAVKTIKGYINIARVLGMSKLQYNTDDLTHSLIGSSPTTMGFLQMYLAPVDGSTTVISIVRVSLTYYTEFFSRVLLAES